MRLNGVGSVNATQDRWEMQGHEKESTFGLNRINFGARTYNPTIARFDRVDPLAENREWLSSYNYVQNNPINRIDIFGLTDGDGDGDGDDDGQVLPELIVRAPRLEGSNGWYNFIQNQVSSSGYKSFVGDYHQSKLLPYKTNFAATIYGRSDGEVDIPEEIINSRPLKTNQPAYC